jgi:predicted GNAT family acetyltransferase
MTSDELNVIDVPDRARYEATAGGELIGWLDYTDRGAVRSLDHAEIDAAYGGRGLGGRLVEAVLDDVRGRGVKVVPVCSFVANHIQRHPEHHDLLQRRGEA